MNNSSQNPIRFSGQPFQPRVLTFYLYILFVLCLIGIAVISNFLILPNWIIGFIGLIVMIGFLPVYVNQPHYLVYTMVAFIPLGFLSLILEHLTVLPILGGLLMLLWIFYMVTGKITVPRVRENTYLFLLAIIITIAVFTGIDILNSLWYLKTMLQILLFTFLVICFINTTQRLYQLGWVIIFAWTLVSLLVVIDHLEILPYKITGEFLYGYMKLERATGTRSDPNSFAMQTSVGLIFSYVYYIYHRDIGIRIMLLCFMFISLVCFLYSYSFGALIGLSSMAIFAIYWSRKITFIQKIAIVLVTLLIIMAVFVFSLPFQQKLEGELAVIKSGQFWMLGSSRVLIWVANANLFLHKPWGVGLGNSGAVAKDYDPWGVLRNLEGNQRSAHNMYISFGAENGIIGEILFLLLLWFSYMGITRALKNTKTTDTQLLTVSLALLASYFCLLVQNLFLDCWTEKYLWVIIGMCISSRILLDSYKPNS